MNEYKQFLKRKDLTAALPFISTKSMHKQYSQFMNKVTIGFEVEVAGGTAFTNENTLDEEATRIAFEEQFSFSEYQFLQIKNTSDIVEEYDVRPKYGFANTKYADLVRDAYYKIDAIGFSVIGHNHFGKKETSYERPFTSVRKLYKNEFTRDNSTLFNLEHVKKLMLEQITFITKFLTDNDIDQGEYTGLRYFDEYQLTNLKTAYVLAESKRAKINEVVARSAIWEFTNSLNIIEDQFRKLFFTLQGSIDDNNKKTEWAVLTELGGLTVVKVDNYTETGLLSPNLLFDKNKFESDYKATWEIVKNNDWDQFLEDARSNLDEEDSDVIDKIYELVLTKVDPDAEFSQGYHSNNVELIRGKKTIVEGDSSIRPAGAEIVSKVFTGTQEAFEWLDDIFDMIEDNGLETNETTGFHVNIGTFNSIVPEYDKARSVLPELDVVKLALLLGDHYLLDQFKRFGNTFTRSISSNLRNLVESGYDFKQAPKQGYSFLIELNKQFITKQNDRYRTINMQNFRSKRYIEFRIAGGANYHKDKEKIKRVIYRYIQLCAVACDPEAYFKEYMTELYKLFNIKNNNVDPLKNKQPRPKTAREALHYLQIWNSTYNLSRETWLNTLSKNENTNIIPEDDFIDSYIESVLEIISVLNKDQYKYVNLNVLYSIRLLMLNTVHHKENPKQFLIDFFKNRIGLITNLMAPKLYKNKPEWVRYFFTGSMPNRAQQELKAMSTIEAGDKIRVTYKNKPVTKKPISNYESIEDTTGLMPQAIASSVFEEIAKVLPNRYKDKSDLIKYLVDKIVRIYDNNELMAKKFKSSKGRDIAYSFMRHWASAYVKKNWSEKEFNKLGPDFANGMELKAMSTIEADEAKPYTNKSKKTKAIYYSNRSTPQTCKPGQTVKAKKGYGKRTKIRNITDEELKLVKKGGWIRTREDGKAHNDPKSKTSKYRPKLAKKQLAARKRRMAASEGSNIFKDFIKEHLGNK